MDIVVGTYEQLLLGFRISKDLEQEGEPYKFTQSFTDHNHIGCVKAMAISDSGVLASGSTDEMIQLLNLKKRVEMGSLIHHQGAVTDLCFHQSTHLFSVSEDACLCIWKYRTWECLRTLRGHKDAITSLSIHPSGKLALTVAKDNTLRTWNLVTGRPAYITNTPHVGDCVRWSPNGDYYAILYPNAIHIYDTASASVHCKIDSKVTVNTMVFCQDTTLAYSVEGGLIHIHDIKADKQLHVIKNHTKRVKCLVSTPSPDDPSVTWLVAGSSSGVIKIWQLNALDLAASSMIAEVDTGFRVICMAAVSQTLDVKVEAEVKEEESSSEEEDTRADSDGWSDEEVITVPGKGGNHTAAVKHARAKDGSEDVPETPTVQTPLAQSKEEKSPVEPQTTTLKRKSSKHESNLPRQKSPKKSSKISKSLAKKSLKDRTKKSPKQTFKCNATSKFVVTDQ